MDARFESADARSLALTRAVLALMEPAVDRRLGKRPAISSESHDLLMAAVEAAAASPEEREDFMEQAEAMAASSVDANWPQIEELLRQAPGIPVFRNLETWPADLLGAPIRPLRATREAKPPGLSRYDIETRHRVAHGIVGAAITGQPVSVGFSGFRVVDKGLAEELHVVILQAGAVADTLLSGAPNLEGGCQCHTMVTDRIMAALGGHSDRPDQNPTRILGKILAEQGLTEAFHDRFVDAWNVAEDLVDRARTSGLLDREAERLQAAGRITIDPIAVAFAVHDFAMIESPTTDDLAVPAIRVAAMAVVERHVGGGPVHATLSLVRHSPGYRNRTRALQTALAVSLAATVAANWLKERPMPGVAPTWGALGTPEGTSAADKRAASLAFALVKRHWLEIEAAAGELMVAGAIDLPARPPNSGLGTVADETSKSRRIRSAGRTRRAK